MFLDHVYFHDKKNNQISQGMTKGHVTSTLGHVLTTSLLRPKIKDAVRTWYGLVGRGRNVLRTYRGLDGREGLGQIFNMLERNVARTGWN